MNCKVKINAKGALMTNINPYNIKVTELSALDLPLAMENTGTAIDYEKKLAAKYSMSYPDCSQPCSVHRILNIKVASAKCFDVVIVPLRDDTKVIIEYSASNNTTKYTSNSCGNVA
jgi:hypothetical protein